MTPSDLARTMDLVTACGGSTRASAHAADRLAVQRVRGGREKRGRGQVRLISVAICVPARSAKAAMVSVGGEAVMVGNAADPTT